MPCVVAIIDNATQCIQEIQRVFERHNYSFHIFRAPKFSLLRPQAGPFVQVKRFFAKIYNEFGVFFARLRYVLSIFFFFFRRGTRFSTVAIGDYRSVPMRQFFRFLDLETIQFIVLDDGSITPEIMAYRHCGANREEIVSGVAVHARKLVLPDPYYYGMPGSFVFFTLYDGPAGKNDTIVRNSFYEDTGNTLDLRTTDEVWICGANHVESRIAVPEGYMTLCRAAARLYPDSPLVYWRHRRESSEKVERVAAAINAVAEYAPEGLECEIIKRKTTPAVFVTFGSTALDTVPLLSKERTEYILLIPDDRYFTGKRIHHITSVMHNTMNSQPLVIALFCADPNARVRSAVKKIFPCDSDTYHIRVSQNKAYLLQIAVAEEGDNTVKICINNKDFVVCFMPCEERGDTGQKNFTEGCIPLRYKQHMYSTFFSATVPVMITQKDASIALATRVDSVCIPADCACAGEEGTLAVAACDPFSGERRVLEVVECASDTDANSLYTLAY